MQDNRYSTPFPPSPPPADTIPEASPSFKFRRLFLLVFLGMATLSLLPFYPEDIDFYAGGITGPTFPNNLLGAFGAHFGWFCLMTLGLATYPLLLVAILCCLRRLLWRRKLLPSSWEYHLAILLFGLGVSLTLGIWPQALPELTARLNIQNLPGGVLGQFFCDPRKGLIFKLLSTVGSLLISLAITLVSLGVIWHYDWELLFGQGRQSRPQPAEPQQEDIPEEQNAPQMPMQNLPQPAAMPQQSPLQEAVASHIPVEAPLGSYGFRGRRGQASLDAARQATEAITGLNRPAPRPVAQQQPARPPMHQPELPVQPQPPPQPTEPRPAPPPAANVADGDYVVPKPEDYYLPPTSENHKLASAQEIENNIQVLQTKLDEFKVDAEVVNAIPGPQITLYEMQMGTGVNVKELSRIHINLSMSLGGVQTRLLTPIPGKNLVGIEVPNKVRETVHAYDLFMSDTWRQTRMQIPLMLGKNISGETRMLDLQKAPHLLVAGATGSGKSVCMNLMLQSMLLKYSPDRLRMILFDPKFLEFAPYSKVPHLICPIINEVKKVSLVLNWACREMDKRYRQLTAAGVKQLTEYNARPKSSTPIYDSDGDEIPDTLPFLVIVIDELADIMTQARKEVEDPLARLAGKARAAGIHMIMATQRPDAKVITGVIKSNFPSRIAFRVTDLINSRVILDNSGAEMLLGAGDMLLSTGAADNERIQCGYVSDNEIKQVNAACACQREQTFDESLLRALESCTEDDENGEEGNGAGLEGVEGSDGDSMDDLVRKALSVLEYTKRPTISNLQRHLRIGYNRSASLVDELETRGYLGPQPISGMREIYWDNFPTGTGSSVAAEETIPAEEEKPEAGNPAAEDSQE